MHADHGRAPRPEHRHLPPSRRMTLRHKDPSSGRRQADCRRANRRSLPANRQQRRRRMGRRLGQRRRVVYRQRRWHLVRRRGDSRRPQRCLWQTHRRRSVQTRGRRHRDIGAYGELKPAADNAELENHERLLRRWRALHVRDPLLVSGAIGRCPASPCVQEFEHHQINRQGRDLVAIGRQNYDKPMFPGLRFGAPYFVWYGKDGAATVHNADKYVYAISNDGHFEDGDNYAFSSYEKQASGAERRRLAILYGWNGIADSSWASDMNKAKPVLENRSNCSMTGMTYIPALGRYVMVVWHYTTYNLHTDPHRSMTITKHPNPGAFGRNSRRSKPKSWGGTSRSLGRSFKRGWMRRARSRLPLRPGLLPEPESVQAELSAGDVFDRALASDPSALSSSGSPRALGSPRFFLISTRYCSFQSVFCRVFH